MPRPSKPTPAVGAAALTVALDWIAASGVPVETGGGISCSAISWIFFFALNGSIDLTMPGSVNANLKARSMNGQVNSDFPITTSGRITSHRLIGTIGEGGPSLQLGTINGGIDLHSSGRTRRDRD